MIAARIASSTATRFSGSEAAVVQPPRAIRTLTPTKAPTEMNAPWPKLMISIRPNTRVRPEAMRKIIMPMARPDTVRVSQLLVDPIARKPSTTSTGIRI